MQKFLHYNKWIGRVTGHDLTKLDYCISISSEEINNKNLRDYIVYKNELIKKDNIVRTSKEKQFTNIEYGKNATVKLNIYPDDAIIKVNIDKYFLQQYIDPYQFDNIQFVEPILKIFVHYKKSLELLGTLEIDLNEYFKTGKYEQDISTVLNKVNITDLEFKTQRCFEKYAYEIFEKSDIVDRNLVNDEYHIKLYNTGKELLIQNNINYWDELEDIKNHKFIISFFSKNRNYLEYYIPFVLQQFKDQSHIHIDIPSTVNLSNTKIHINSKKIKIKYENTDN